MTGKIKILDQITANQIAAGEVVERPVSVVKELIENSIDAGSTRIDIEIREGGTSWIRITDNGCGMSASDALLAFERHATSKINTVHDLYNIHSLGFRGEALPSICSVARVEMTTRPSEQLVGTKLIWEGGKLIETVETGAPPGTTIVIRDLFYNTPARLKHLRSVGTEGGLIGDVVTRLALAYPGIAFTFTQNGKVAMQSSGSGNLLDVIVSAQGVQSAKEYYELKTDDELFSLEGYLGKPSLSRANRTNQILFVNGRYVKSKLVSIAIEEAYHTFLTIGRHPVYVLNLRLNPHLVDVNVHPTKMEVRFSEEQHLQSFITTETKKLLAAQTRNLFITENIRETAAVSYKFPNQTAENKAASKEYPVPRNTSAQLEPVNYVNTEIKKDDLEKPNTTTSDLLKTDGQKQDQEEPVYPILSEQQFDDNTTNTLPLESQDQFDFSAKQSCSIFSELQVLGQADCTYIIATGPQGLYIFDQHAVHERIQYEKLLNAAEQSTIEQSLLIPINVQLSPLDVELVISNILLFREIGYTLEHFGGNTFIIRSAPKGLPPGEESMLFFDLLDYLKGKNPYQIDRLKIKEEYLIRQSCKSAIKANQPLSKPIMEELLKQLGETEQPFTCPHGRPTLVNYTGNDLAKIFKRT